MKPLFNFWLPTKGEESVVTTIESVQKQTYENCKMTIGTDTEEGHESIEKILKHLKPKNVTHYKFPERVTNRVSGGRPESLTSAAIYSINYDLWQPIGSGDWFEPNHAELTYKTFKEKNAFWTFTLRKIWDWEGKFITKDIFESIGFYPVYTSIGGDNPFEFVDGQSFCLPRNVAICVGHLFTLSRDMRVRTDSFIFENLRKMYPKFACTDDYTLNFRLNRGTPEQLQEAKEWYLKGYDYMIKKFPDGKFPWLNKKIEGAKNG